MTRRVFDHIVIVMMENEYRGLVLENETLARLATQGVDMTSYYGTFHPSQTNYLASIAGEQCGWQNDDPVWPLLTQTTVVDLLEAAGLEWKAYMEDLPPCPWNPRWATPDYYDAPQPPADLAPPTHWPADNPSYWQKHNPFASFRDIQFRMDRWQRIVDLEQFFADVDAGQLPAYSWITPNIWNDGHYQQGQQSAPKDRSILIDQIASWLEDDFLGRLRLSGPDSALPPRTLVVVTFDESDFEDTIYQGPNRIYTVLLGDVVEPGTSEPEPYNHYSLLRTVEENFGLGTLAKNDAGSNWLRFLWGERFGWRPPAPLDASSQGGVAAPAPGGRMFLVTEGADGELRWQASDDGGSWSAPAPVGQRTSGPFALAAGSEMLLVYRGDGDQLFALPHDPGRGFAPTPIPLGVTCSGAIALTALAAGGFVLVYTDGDAHGANEANGANGGNGGDGALPMASLLIEIPLRDPLFTTPLDLDRSTVGSLALATLGTTVYLVYGEAPAAGAPGGRMLVTSLETACFNTVVGDEYGSTTVGYRWAPPPLETPPTDGGLYVVGQVRADGAIVDSPPPTFPTWVVPGEPLAMAQLDGRIHLFAPSAHTGELLCQGYSLCGVMTSESPTTLEFPAPAGHGVGWGTLMEAGWGPVEALDLPARTEAATAHGDEIVLFVVSESGSVRMVVGGYEGGDDGG